MEWLEETNRFCISPCWADYLSEIEAEFAKEEWLEELAEEERVRINKELDLWSAEAVSSSSADFLER